MIGSASAATIPENRERSKDKRETGHFPPAQQILSEGNVDDEDPFPMPSKPDPQIAGTTEEDDASADEPLFKNNVYEERSEKSDKKADNSENNSEKNEEAAPGPSQTPPSEHK